MRATTLLMTMTSVFLATLLATALEAQTRPPNAVDIQLQKPIRFTTARGLQLTPSSERAIDALAEQLIESWSGHDVWIVGHTDRRGEEVANLDVSSRRAGLVRALLIERGLDPRVVHAQGRGEYEPLHRTKGRRARRLNRRVEVYVVPREVVEPEAATLEPVQAVRTERPQREEGLSVVLLSGVATITRLEKPGGTRSLYLREEVPGGSRISTDTGAYLAVRDRAGAVVLVGSQTSVVISRVEPLTLDVLGGTIEVIQPKKVEHAVVLETAGIRMTGERAQVSLAVVGSRVLVATQSGTVVVETGDNRFALAEGRTWCRGTPDCGTPSEMLPAPGVVAGHAPLDGQLAWRQVEGASGYLVMFSYDPGQLHRVSVVRVDDPWFDLTPGLRSQGLWWSVLALDARSQPGRRSPVFRVPPVAAPAEPSAMSQVP